VEKDVIDGFTNKGSEIEEFAVDSMKSGFQKVSLSRVL
jgi:hypothetical protein